MSLRAVLLLLGVASLASSQLPPVIAGDITVGHLEWAKTPVNLQNMLNGCEQELEDLVNHLSDNGWAIVVLPDELGELVETVQSPLQDFFQGATVDNTQEYRIDTGFGLGFDGDEHQASLQYTTGTTLQTYTAVMPLGISAILPNLMDKLDDTLGTVAHMISESLHGTNIFLPARPRTRHLPLLDSDPKQGSARYALFDASWRGESPALLQSKARQANENNGFISLRPIVQDRYDPGLLTLHVLQTAPGMQLLSNRGYWVDAPVGYVDGVRAGVITIGAAAEGVFNDLEVAVWRVLETGLQRLALSSEICTREQVFPSLLSNKIQQEEKFLYVPNVFALKGGVTMSLPPLDEVDTALITAQAAGVRATKNVYYAVPEVCGRFFTLDTGFQSQDGQDEAEYVPYEYISKYRNVYGEANVKTKYVQSAVIAHGGRNSITTSQTLTSP